jgi:hypothetical protein
MSATAFSAMLHAGKVSGTGERELKKHLHAHLGQGFCPSRQSVNMLAEGQSAVQYGCMDFTFPGQEKAEFIEWTEKNIDDEITLNLQCYLSSKSISPSDIVRIQIVAGGDHGDTAFQFGALVSVELVEGVGNIDFEVSVCKVICQKDTAKLIESTILTQLTNGLEMISTMPLHIHTDELGNIQCQFSNTPPSIRTTTPIIDVYITGDLAFQAMVLGKESMAGHWCMLCTSSRANFLQDDVTLWTMEELVRLGTEAEQRTKGEPELGVKKKLWWPFIPLSNYMIPILHCEIGVGNQLLEKLRDITNEHIEIYAPGEELTRSSIPVLKQIIADTAKLRDDWDASADGKQWTNSPAQLQPTAHLPMWMPARQRNTSTHWKKLNCKKCTISAREILPISWRGHAKN